MHRTPLAALLAACLAAAVSSQNVPTGFVVDTLSTGLSTPNDCCFLPDGRVLVANSAGLVSLFAGTTVSSVGTVPNVESGGERGLLSIAADPNFPANGYVYVYYSSILDTFMHVDRFTCTGDLSNPASNNLMFAGATRRAVLGALPDNAGNHNGGSLRFGPDGMLYLSVGDDAGACNAQLLTSQVGCLLRFDVGPLGPGASATLPTYSSLDPGNNPLSANLDFSQLVIAHGLRNPFRMEIDAVTGNLYIGDVGQSAEEEYSEYVYPSGALPLVNFGWPWREGMIPGFSCSGSQPAGLVDPIVSVPRSQGWASIMGGARYRNQGQPFDFGQSYEGCCFYLDYFVGEMRRLVHNGTAWGPAPAVPGQPNPTNWGTGFGSVTSMRMGPDGALYFTQHGNFLKRVRALGPTNSVVAISGGGQAGPAGETFAMPLRAQVLDPQNAPLPNGTVNFSVSGPGVLSTTNPVIADANGFVQTTVTATNLGGPISVTAATPNSQTPATFGLYSRKITAVAAGQYLVVSISNATAATPPVVPYIVMISFPGSPILPTIVGNLCIDPNYALAFVIEDGTGAFGYFSLSGSGGVGNPGLTKLYTPPPGLFTGQLMHFQAVGIDPITGWFRTNCEQRQF
ncbi:MAG: PQQ-dependent sugar dehydrogenase [Planctomycetes bacterium]|nr:PQQ-dependent sugar dehydrogenase [Planctomycetota bacterium]MCB9884727.1 PQQ-dependent sugar dehydrogenase [Planctomycetota bacterium]